MNNDDLVKALRANYSPNHNPLVFTAIEHIIAMTKCIKAGDQAVLNPHTATDDCRACAGEREYVAARRALDKVLA
jgi:hypothetical protein